jgi:hypothetical protein
MIPLNEPTKIRAPRSQPMEYRDKIWIVVSTKGNTTLHWAAATSSEDAVTAVELLLGPGWTVALTERHITPEQVAALRLCDNEIRELQLLHD